MIKLLPSQVPVFWEAIKYSCKQADEIDDARLPAYLNELLQALLCERAQCWARLDDNRILIALMITRILYDKQFDERYLYIQSLYSWKLQPEDIWRRDMVLIRDFAKGEGCKYVGCTSRNERVWEILKSHGFKEYTRIFSLRME